MSQPVIETQPGSPVQPTERVDVGPDPAVMRKLAVIDGLADLPLAAAIVLAPVLGIRGLISHATMHGSTDVSRAGAPPLASHVLISWMLLTVVVLVVLTLLDVLGFRSADLLTMAARAAGTAALVVLLTCSLAVQPAGPILVATVLAVAVAKAVVATCRHAVREHSYAAAEPVGAAHSG